MLLHFSTKNYKSFKEELSFSLEPAPKQKGLDYSVFHKAIGEKIYKALSSAVVYGPNASGKTNIIGAMETFKSIILRGNILNAEKNTPNHAASSLELIPNRLNDNSVPVDFSIQFISNGTLFEYELSIYLGAFLEVDYDRKIQRESLSINGDEFFTREKHLTIGNLSNYADRLVKDFDKHKGTIVSVAENNLNDKELFLMNGFKVMFSPQIVSEIVDWLKNKFLVIYHADALITNKEIPEVDAGMIHIEKMVNDAANIFGINSNALGYLVDVNNDNKETRLCSLFEKQNGESGIAIPAEVYESYGTIRFVNLFPLIASVFVNGGILVVDEFDASIHPMALMNIINIFHNDEINVNHAQLVFNTHNPIFLNSNIYRRDEIKFVEYDEDLNSSNHYSLSDFGTAGKGGVRKNDDYMKNYFVDRYGAIKDIDFTSVFMDLLKEQRERA